MFETFLHYEIENTVQTSNKFYTQLKVFTNYKTNTIVSTFNHITINCNDKRSNGQFTVDCPLI
jgi:hypothetical protein